MFIKVTQSQGHRYAQVVESYRNAQGQPRQRNVLTLGRSDEIGGTIDNILQSLLKARALEAAAVADAHIEHQKTFLKFSK